MNKRFFTLGLLITVIVAASFLSAYVAAPQSEGRDVVTIRMMENELSRKSGIYIVKSGESRVVEIDGYFTREDPVKNFKTFSKIIEEYVKKGYGVESATTVHQQISGSIIHDYVLVK